MDEYAVPAPSDDPVCVPGLFTRIAKFIQVSTGQFEEKIAQITISLRDRMRFYKLPVSPNAASVASTFNEPFKPEIIAEHNDPYRIDWIDDSCREEFLVGEKVSLLVCSIVRLLTLVLIGASSSGPTTLRVCYTMANLWF